MQIELILFIVMVGVFLAGCFFLKLPVSISMALSAVVTALVSGNGIPIRHLVEGTFGYLDTILVIGTAMLFMKFMQATGALELLNCIIIKRFHTKPAILLISLMFIVMFPGMITGSSTAAVISAGALVYPVFLMLGIPKEETAAIIAIGGMMGMIAPPINVPAMIIGGGIDMPFVGFELPLILLSFPIAIFTVLYLGGKYTKTINYAELEENLDFSLMDKYGAVVFMPLAVVVTLMILTKAVPGVVPNIGMPLIFIIGCVLTLFVGKKFNIFVEGRKAFDSALPVMGILMGVGMFVQIMTLTGVRGYIVVTFLGLPDYMIYLAIAVTVPLFGAISSFGSASVLCVPFLLALIDRNQIITGSALSLMSSMGELMPPTALAGLFAARIVGVKNYLDVLKKSVVPGIVIIAWSIIFIMFANQIGSIVF